MIAFAATDDLSPLNDGSWDLYVMNSDGTGTRQLTTDVGLGAEFDITWQRI
jgi:Tol biopolymer transport system component